MKFRVAKQTLSHVLLGCAKFHVNQCNESPLQGKNADFWPVSKFNTGSLPLCGILLVTRFWCSTIIAVLPYYYYTALTQSVC